jgi:hypothetical protein
VNTDALRAADAASLAAVLLSLVAGLVALPTLPAEVAVQWAADGSPNTVLPVLPGVLLTPAIAALALAYLRGGAVLAGRRPGLGATTALGVVAGVAYLQVALVALNLGWLGNPLVAVAPGLLAVLAATVADRTGVAGPA